MAETVYTRDGKAHTVLCDDSPIEIIEEALGADVARKIRMLLSDTAEMEALREELADAENRIDDLEDDLHTIQQDADSLLTHLNREDITIRRIKARCEDIVKRAEQ